MLPVSCRRYMLPKRRRELPQKRTRRAIRCRHATRDTRVYAAAEARCWRKHAYAILARDATLPLLRDCHCRYAPR